MLIWKTMKTVIADCRIDKICEETLLSKGFDIIKLPPSKNIQAPTASHPDMLVFIGEGRLFCHQRYYDIAKNEIYKILKIGGLSLCLSEERWDAEYPSDVLFNAAKIGNRVICRRKSTSKGILELYGDRVIDTKQGYAKCSSCIVGDSGIITADPSIKKAADNAGLDVLFIASSCAELHGYDVGFFGGVSGDDGENIYFCGDLDTHPEHESIKAFCQKHGRGTVSLSKAPLYDYGSLIFI